MNLTRVPEGTEPTTSVDWDVCTTIPGWPGGRQFLVRVLTKGMRYGRGDMLVYTHDRPTVEFYDYTYADCGDFGSRGQYVSAYYLDTLEEHRGALSMDDGVPVWTLDGDAVRDAVRFARNVLGFDGNDQDFGFVDDLIGAVWAALDQGAEADDIVDQVRQAIDTWTPTEGAANAR